LEYFYWKPKYQINLVPQCPRNDLTYPLLLNEYNIDNSDTILNDIYTETDCAGRNGANLISTQTVIGIQGTINSGALYMYIQGGNNVIGLRITKDATNSNFFVTSPANTAVDTSMGGINSFFGTEALAQSNSISNIGLSSDANGAFVISCDLHDFPSGADPNVKQYISGTQKYINYANIVNQNTFVVPFSIIDCRDQSGGTFSFLIKDKITLPATPNTPNRIILSGSDNSDISVKGLNTLSQCIDVTDVVQSTSAVSIKESKLLNKFKLSINNNNNNNQLWSMLFSFTVLLNVLCVFILLILWRIRNNLILKKKRKTLF